MTNVSTPPSSGLHSCSSPSRSIPISSHSLVSHHRPPRGSSCAAGHRSTDATAAYRSPRVQRSLSGRVQAPRTDRRRRHQGTPRGRPQVADRLLTTFGADSPDGGRVVGPHVVGIPPSVVAVPKVRLDDRREVRPSDDTIDEDSHMDAQIPVVHPVAGMRFEDSKPFVPAALEPPSQFSGDCRPRGIEIEQVIDRTGEPVASTSRRRARDSAISIYRSVHFFR